MYRKNSPNGLKHLDFHLLDILCLHLAFFLAFVIRHGGGNPYQDELYRNSAIVLTLLSVLVSLSLGSFQQILRRDRFEEFSESIKHSVIVMLLMNIFLFANQEGQDYSRITFFLMAFLYAVFTYGSRIIWKKILRRRLDRMGSRILLIITNSEKLEHCIQSIKGHKYRGYSIVGFALTDANRIGETVEGLPIVASKDTLIDFVCNSWVDEVFINLPATELLPEETEQTLFETGIVIHKRIAKESDMVGKKQFTESLAEYTVLTTTMNYASPFQLMLKRLLDIVGGLVGCIVTGILFIFLAPAIKIASPGPVFFAQERVGQNGKHFKIYKFRSMYMDAEERKAELMKQNKMSDEFMFKMDEDPRIIGSKILPDGTYKKGLGNFIRDFSLDEFPQFWSCLIGDMSLVGTRPPTVKEVALYAPHHHARLAAKPGITGMWQVSGRNNITDFEEVVRLDTKYINEWNILLDFKILFRTVGVVLKRDGSM